MFCPAAKIISISEFLVDEDYVQLIEEAGRLNVPGRPIQYKTTSDFLRTFGLSSLEELPPIEKITFGEPVELPEQPPAGEEA